MNEQELTGILQRAPIYSFQRLNTLLVEGMHSPTLFLTGLDGNLAACYVDPRVNKVQFTPTLQTPFTPTTVSAYRAMIPRFACGFRWTGQKTGEEAIALSLWHPEAPYIDQAIEMLRRMPETQRHIVQTINDCKQPKEITSPLFEGIALSPEIYDPFNL